VAADDPYDPIARKIINDAIEGIEFLTIMEAAEGQDLDIDELDKRVRNAAISITIPTASGCTCLGLEHRRECADWRMPW
jgi:hypothetical protein